MSMRSIIIKRMTRPSHRMASQFPVPGWIESGNRVADTVRLCRTHDPLLQSLHTAISLT